MIEIKLEGRSLYTVTAEEGPYTVTANICDDGRMDFIHLSLKAEEPVTPPCIKVSWDVPSIDVQGVWNTTCGLNRCIPDVWGGGGNASATYGAPVNCLFSTSGENRMTYGCSDAVNVVNYRFVLREEDSRWLCSTTLFGSPTAALDSYDCDVRVDYRPIPYEEAIGDVVSWWAAMPEYEPMAPVDECLHPLYSTWYSFHQYAYGDEIEEVLESAAPLGFKAVIVDDGWQMEDSGRTYNYCGDWEVAPGKIRDMKAHVAKVHAMGLKYYLWYSVPFVGKFSRAYERFAGKFLNRGDVVTFDPRYPDVREYLISTYENAVKEWDLDGFKLDFVDNFRQPAKEFEDAAPGRDFISVSQAVDRLMTDIKLRLQALKPDIAIEFRQSYIGPVMRKYANMFRAGDCANDTVANKIRTIDLRLAVGTSAVHSDMITWSREETPEAAALQFVGTMFSVQQISVRPATLPEEHRMMLRRWIDFWESYRETILYGKFRAQSPELMYTSATAEDENCFVAGAFACNTVIPAPAGNPEKLAYANGSGTEGIIVRLPAGATYEGEIRDCLGNIVSAGQTNDPLTELPVPVGGTAELRLVK